MNLNQNALKVLQARYLRNGETPENRFRAVADAVASAEQHGQDKWSDRFYEMLTSLDFLPNTPCLANAGRDRNATLDACYVLPISDALTTQEEDGILDVARWTGLIHQTGGGTGFDFSALRPSGSPVATSNGVASGPVSFIQLIDAVTNSIKQGGIRRGANMAVLDISHPDILEFIDAKTKELSLVNFNISVLVPDAFMLAVRENTEWTLGHPSTPEVTHISARKLWSKITTSAWKFGDPGVIFVDSLNRDNPLKQRITATNPCGEVPLLPWEACTLGSVNLSHFVHSRENLDYTVRLAVRFLDNVVSVNKTPVSKIDYMTRQTRRIGLGVMGWADALNILEIPYDSNEAVAYAKTLAKTIREVADDESRKIAIEKGAYPMSPDGLYRNVARLSIAPTGSISTIAGCSAGIEPYFSREVVRKVAIGELTEKYRNSDKPWFRTAMEIDPAWHVQHQAAWQARVDNAVSKTINMRRESTPEDVQKVYELAYSMGCKGITIYRDGSRENQVYNKIEHAEFNQCPSCGSSAIRHQEGCESCEACGWTVCTT